MSILEALSSSHDDVLHFINQAAIQLSFGTSDENLVQVTFGIEEIGRRMIIRYWHRARSLGNSRLWRNVACAGFLTAGLETVPVPASVPVPSGHITCLAQMDGRTLKGEWLPRDKAI